MSDDAVTHAKSDWEGNHPNAHQCSKDGCDSVQMNIITARGIDRRMVICAECGRVNLNPREN